MDFTTGLSVGLIIGSVGGFAVGFYNFARAVVVSESDTEQEEIIQEPSNATETAEPENISQNKAQKYSGAKRRRKKGITGRSKKKRKRGG